MNIIQSLFRRTKSQSYVIGLPGFVHESEQSRVDLLLQELDEKANIPSFKVNMPGIEREGNLITCKVVLEEAVEAINETVKKVQITYPKVKLGFFGSSIACGIFGHYLTSQYENPFICCAQVSPSPGWNYFSTREMRKEILKSGKGLDLTSEKDKRNGITRLMPHEYLERSREIDAIKSLTGLRNMEVLTLIGNKDNTVEQTAMWRYHYILGGDENKIIRYDAGHDIPHEETRKALLDFFTQTLK